MEYNSIHEWARDMRAKGLTPSSVLRDRCSSLTMPTIYKLLKTGRLVHGIAAMKVSAATGVSIERVLDPDGEAVLYGR